MWAKLSKQFFNGLIILLPLFITIWLLWLMFSFADGIFGGFIALIAGRSIPGLGFVITIALIFIVGYIGSYLIGQRLLSLGDMLMTRIPVIKSIYSSVKQVNEVFFQQKEAKKESTFRRACIFEYPRKGVWTVGFVTSEAAEEITVKTSQNLVNVFVPNTPTPATGFMVVVPAGEVIMLDMKLDDAFKMIVSAGVLSPKYLERKA